MEMVAYQPAYLRDLTRLVNAHLQTMPPYWTLNEAQVRSIVDDPEQLWAAHYLDGESDGPLRLTTQCVIEGDRLLAAAQWHRPGDGGTASLFWALAETDATDALVALLNVALHQCQDEGNCELRTVRFGFSIGWSNVPDPWPHVTAAFEQTGFDAIETWVLASVDTINLPPTSRPVPPVRLAWENRLSAGEWNVNAYDSDTLAGECQAWDPPPCFADCTGYDTWTTVEWLGVEEAYRRRGLGRSLLAEQVRFQARRGIRHVLVWTETDKEATRQLNRSLGFSEGPTCTVYRHPLTVAGEPIRNHHTGASIR